MQFTFQVISWTGTCRVRSDLVELMHLSCPSVSVEALGDSRKISLAPREADGTPTFTGILSCNEETARMAIDLEERLYAFEAEKKSTKLEMLFMTLWVCIHVNVCTHPLLKCNLKCFAGSQ